MKSLIFFLLLLSGTTRKFKFALAIRITPSPPDKKHFLMLFPMLVLMAGFSFQAPAAAIYEKAGGNECISGAKSPKAYTPLNKTLTATTVCKGEDLPQVVNSLPFITIWKTDNPGISGTNQITIPGTGTNYDISWEQVGNPAVNGTATGNGATTVTFPSAGTYRVSISGNFTQIQFNNAGDRLKLLDIEQWGSIVWSSMERAFSGCSNLNSSATDAPDLSAVTNLVFMFSDCPSFNGAIGNWNTTNVTDMGGMFYNASAFNQPIGNRNTTNVTSMSAMFQEAGTFNQPIGNWNTANVTSMGAMFYSASAFNQPIGNWNTANVDNMGSMFQYASSFNQNIGNWALNSTVTLWLMFDGTGLDCINYSAILTGWGNNPSTPYARSIVASGRQYGTNAQAARNNLVNNKGWTILGDSPSNTVCLPCSLAANCQPSHNAYINNVGQAEVLATSLDDGSTGCGTLSFSINGQPSFTFGCNDIGSPQTVTLTVTDDNGSSTCTLTVNITDNNDSDGDGTVNCNDQCPNDPAKTSSGTCGCGIADADSDGDGTLNCNDQCPNDPAKTSPGACGCGTPDTDSDGDGYYSCLDDCNDNNPAMYPGNTEICDGYDNDCDGQLNEGVLLTFYWDSDGDGYGNPAISIQHCSPPSGYVANNSDCDDSNSAVKPGAIEICDGLDNNCNGYTDDNDITLVDTQKPTVTCKPHTAVLGPNGLANVTVADVMLGYTDNCSIVSFNLDKKVFSCLDLGQTTVTLTATDRKGTSASCIASLTVAGSAAGNNGIPELCNGLDDNCNGQVDEGFDQDGDGFSACGGDCNDGNALVYPGAPEWCNGIDDNCNGLVDEGGIIYYGNVTFSTQAQVDAWSACYTKIQGYLTVMGLGITDLGPLANLTAVTGSVIIKFTHLTNLNGLEGLASIGNHLEIQNNGWLISLNGLENLATITKNLGVFQNGQLKDCCAIYPLLSGSGIGGAKSIFFNDTGCDNLSQIMSDCGASPLIGLPLDGVSATKTSFSMQLQPNPASEDVVIGFQGLYHSGIELTIFDHLGRAVLFKKMEKGQTSLNIDLEDRQQFRSGVYLVSAVTEDGKRMLKKLVITK